MCFPVFSVVVLFFFVADPTPATAAKSLRGGLVLCHNLACFVFFMRIASPYLGRAGVETLLVITAVGFSFLRRHLLFV